jgi:hypothetical protein
MRISVVGAATLAVGLVLLVLGINASGSPMESLMHGLTGQYIDRTTWMLVGGVGLIVVGVVLTLRRWR